MAEELAELELDAEGREELEREVAAALDAYRKQALALSAGRRAWGGRLAAAIEAELGDLGLGKARLEARLERRRLDDSPLHLPPGDEATGDEEGGDGGDPTMPVEFGATGIDQVVFYFAPNPGEEPRPLSVIASGGELSRIYLALQLAVLAGEPASPAKSPARRDGGTADGAGGPTLVFDEVDVGIGGAQAAALGRKLQRLAGGYQVLVVTHLPQVASFGDHHFKVAKEVRGERTFTRVEPLGAEERAAEVARMLAGERTTDLSLSHARELLGAAAESRQADAR